MATIILRGGFNNLLQPCELLNFSADSGMKLRVFFRDEDSGIMSHTKINELTMSSEYRGRRASVRDLARQKHQADFSALFQKAKASGHVKLSGCKNSLLDFDLRPEALILEIDEMQSAESFWKEAAHPSDKVVSV